MTNEEAIHIMNAIIYMLEPQYDKEIVEEAVSKAIKALEQQPSEDAVSREAVLEGLANIAKAKAKSDAQKSMMGRCMFFVEQLPPVTPQRTKGKWITQAYSMRITCTNCEKEIWYSGRNDYIYCPSCGAEMEGGEDGDSN